MLVPDFLKGQNFDIYKNIDSRENSSHAAFKERLRKTLRYGKTPTFDRPSLPMTELAVELLQGAAPRELGKIDMTWAADISRRAAVSPCALMLAMVYIERLRHRDPHYLQQVASSDLFLISMMVASKYLYDEGVTEEVFNEEWAGAAHMDVGDINALEREFLSATDWQLYVKPRDFFQELTSMEQRIALDEWAKHGVASYTDLDVLTSRVDWSDIVSDLLHTIAEVVAVCSVAYLASLLTLLLAPSALSLARSSLPHSSPLPLPSLPSPPQVSSPSTHSMEFDLTGATTTDDDDDDDVNDDDATNKNGTLQTGKSHFLPLVLIRDTVLAFVIGGRAETEPDVVDGNTIEPHGDDELSYVSRCDCSDPDGSTWCAYCKLHNDQTSSSRQANPNNYHHGDTISSLDSWQGQCVQALHWLLPPELPTLLHSSFGDILLGFKTMPASAAAAG